MKELTRRNKRLAALQAKANQQVKAPAREQFESYVPPTPRQLAQQAAPQYMLEEGRDVNVPYTPPRQAQLSYGVSSPQAIEKHNEELRSALRANQYQPSHPFAAEYQGKAPGSRVDIPADEYVKRMKDFEQTRPKMAWEDRNRPRPAAARMDIPFASEGNQVLRPFSGEESRYDRLNTTRSLDPVVDPKAPKHQNYVSKEPYNEELYYPGATTAVRAAVGKNIVRDQASGRADPEQLPPGKTGFFDPEGAPFEEQFAAMSPETRLSALRNPKLAPTVRSMATMEERYKAQNIEPSPPPDTRMNIQKQLGVGGEVLKAAYVTPLKAAYQANDPNYYTGWMPQGAQDALTGVANTIEKGTPAMRALERFATTGGQATRRFLDDNLGGLNQKLETYADTGQWPQGPEEEAATGPVTPATAQFYRDPKTGNFSDKPTPGYEPYQLGQGTDSSGIKGPDLYQNADSSVSSTPGEGAQPFQTSGRTAEVMGLPSRNPTGYDNTDVYNLRNGGPAGYGLSGDRLPGRERPPEVRGQRSGGLGLRTNTSVAGSTATFPTPVHNSATDDITKRYGYGTLRKPISFNSGQLAGTSEGGGLLQQVQKLQKKAADEFERVFDKTNNQQAATQASDVYAQQVDQLLGLSEIDRRRESDYLDLEVAQITAEASALADDKEAYREFMSKNIDAAASYVDPESGKVITDPKAFNDVASWLGDPYDPANIDLIPRFRMVMQIKANYETMTGQGFTELTFKELMDGSGFWDSDIKFSDRGQFIGVGDVVNDFFDWLPFVNDAQMITLNGQEMRLDKLLENAGVSYEEMRGKIRNPDRKRRKR